MVRYTRPPSPTWQATTRSAPTKHLSDQHGQMAVIKLQSTENKGVIWMVKAVFAVTDEGDEEAAPLLDMTKVTRSTLGDSPRPHKMGRPLDNALMARRQKDLKQCRQTQKGAIWRQDCLVFLPQSVNRKEEQNKKTY